MDDLAHQAVAQALTGNWAEAQKINLEILKQNPQDTQALNRLAKAYFKLGKINDAKKTSEKVLKIDPFNSIAEKSLKKWRNLSTKDSVEEVALCSPQIFLEEPGKSFTANLINLGDKKIIAKLDPGEKIDLICHTHRVCLNTLSGKYLGRLSDDLASRLRRMKTKGSEFQASIKSIGKNSIKIFIKEIKSF